MRRELFTDGYRDPGDDGHRMVYYVSGALGFLGSLAGLVYSAGLLFRGRGMFIETLPGQGAVDYRLPALTFVLCALMMLRIALWARPEIRRARGRKVSADAFVAGGFLVGLALIFLGMERGLLRFSYGRSTMLGTIGLGLGILLASLIVGLAIAFKPNLSRPKTMAGVVVQSRYAVDKRLMEIEDHPDPVGEECIPMVRLLTTEGKELTLRAHPEAYDLATPGSAGTARIVKGRLQVFRPSRRT